jgi:hypothetical protein
MRTVKTRSHYQSYLQFERKKLLFQKTILLLLLVSNTKLLLYFDLFSVIRINAIKTYANAY